MQWHRPKCGKELFGHGKVKPSLPSSPRNDRRSCAASKPTASFRTEKLRASAAADVRSSLRPVVVSSGYDKSPVNVTLSRVPVLLSCGGMPTLVNICRSQTNGDHDGDSALGQSRARISGSLTGRARVSMQLDFTDSPFIQDANMPFKAKASSLSSNNKIPAQRHRPISGQAQQSQSITDKFCPCNCHHGCNGSTPVASSDSGKRFTRSGAVRRGTAQGQHALCLASKRAELHAAHQFVLSRSRAVQNKGCNEMRNAFVRMRPLICTM